MASLIPFAPSVERAREHKLPSGAPFEHDLRWDDPFLLVVDEAIAQVEPRLGREVRMLAQLGLAVEAEHLLIDYLLAKHPSYEIFAAEQGYLASYRQENSVMHRVTTALTECSTLGTFITCLAWVGLGH